MPERKEGVVPRLRFPEFRNAGEWKVKRLVDIADVNAAGDLDSKEFSPVRTQDHIYPVYSNSVAQEGLYGFCSYPKYKKESVTITARGTLGVAFYRDHDFVGIGRLLIVSNLHETSPRFLKELWNHLVREPFEDGGIPQLTAIKARRVKLFLPNLSEQQKIADCLSSLDEVIELEVQKLEALKAHKKGLMQQLFPREGETTPRLRFPEFRDAGPWEVKRLGEICDILQGYGFPEKFQGKTKGKYPFCKVSDITYAVNNTGGAIARAENYVDDEDIESLRARPIPIGATIFAKIGEALRLNKRALVSVECLIDNNVVALKGLDNQTKDHFVLYLSQKIDLNKYYGGAIPAVNKSTLESIKLSVPEVDEQQKIADCLTSLDEVIELQAKELDALKTHKKGLMQQLFPQEVD